jgi:hypothetical protein
MGSGNWGGIDLVECDWRKRERENIHLVFSSLLHLIRYIPSNLNAIRQSHGPPELDRRANQREGTPTHELHIHNWPRTTRGRVICFTHVASFNSGPH